MPAPTTATARSKAALYGYKLALVPAHQGAPPHVLGWTDHAFRICFVYTDRLWGAPYGLWVKIALHEVGHARWEVRGRTPAWWQKIRGMAATVPDQRVEEDYCEVYSKSTYAFPGMGYTLQAPRPSALKLAWLRLRL